MQVQHKHSVHHLEPKKKSIDDYPVLLILPIEERLAHHVDVEIFCHVPAQGWQQQCGCICRGEYYSEGGTHGWCDLFGGVQ